MAHPDNELSTLVVTGEFLEPDSWYRGNLEDYELAGYDISDPSRGLQYQVWHLTYNDDEIDANYGDFTITALTTGVSYNIITVAGVKNCGFAFDQNMRPSICYELNDESGGGSYYYWYDSNIPGFTTTQLPAGSVSPRMTLDDKRDSQTSTSDIILGYIRGTTLYYRQQRDRFDTERTLATDITPPLNTIGMGDHLRVIYDTGFGRGMTLCQIVKDLCDAVGLPEDNYDVTELCDELVRGFLVAGMYSAADTIRGLQKVYFFDVPEIDQKLRAIIRGHPIEDTITQADYVRGEEVNFETAREQGVEYPRKVHLEYSCAEYDYTPSKQTSERRSPDIKSTSEITYDSAVNHTPEDAADRVARMHTIAWNEMEGSAEFGVDESWWRLSPSNPILVEVRPDVYRRLRIIRMNFTEGVHEITAVRDRASTYETENPSIASGLPPSPPASNIVGPTTWEYMDLPALITDHDSLHYYVAGRGEPNYNWTGYQLQRFVGSDWIVEADSSNAELMGTVVEAAGDASPYFIDTTTTILASFNRDPESVSDTELLSGAGAFVVGNEIIQVRDWVAEDDYWRGSYLLRGRLNTEPTAHAIDTRIVYLGAPVRVPVDVSRLDTDLTLRAISYGETTADSGNYTFGGKSQEEWAPELLTAEQSGSDWILNWIARYPLGNSVTPIPHSNFYGWRLRFTVGATTATRDIDGRTPAFTYTSAMQTADFGSAQNSFDTVEIRGLNYLGGEGQALSESI